MTVAPSLVDLLQAFDLPSRLVAGEECFGNGGEVRAGSWIGVPPLRPDRLRIGPAPIANRPGRPGSFLLWHLLPVDTSPQEPAWRNGRR